MTIANKLNDIITVKSNIKQAIEDQGVLMSGVPFTNYPDKILEIGGGGGDQPWEKPDEWFSTDISSTEMLEGNIIKVLMKVNPDSREGFSIACSQLTGSTLNIDWGDGTTQTSATISNTNYEKSYLYSDLPSSSETSYGYKQVLITIKCNNFNAITINKPSSISGTYISKILDVNFAIGNIRATPFTKTNINYFFIERVRFEGDYLNITPASSTTSLCSGLTNLQSFKQFNYTGASLISFLNMFLNCSRLKFITINIDKANSIQSLFSGCTSLKYINENNTLNVSNISCQDAFLGCENLKTITVIGNISIIQSMFQNCYNLEYVKLPNLTLNNASSVFYSCYNLTKVEGEFNISNLLSNIFRDCYRLTETPILICSSTTSSTNIGVFQNCYSLSKINLQNINFNCSFVNTNISTTEIINIFNNLAVVTTARTITLTGLPCVIDLTPADIAIATGKGWTVTL